MERERKKTHKRKDYRIRFLDENTQFDSTQNTKLSLLLSLFSYHRIAMVEMD